MQQTTLVRAVERLAAAGERAGISVEAMIQILNAGVSVETLLDIIEGRLRYPRQESGRSSGWII